MEELHENMEHTAAPRTLLVKALVGRGIFLNSTKRSRAALTFRLGDVVKRTAWIPVENGTCSWRGQVVFQPEDCANSSVIEIALLARTSSGLISRGEVVVGSCSVAYAAFAEISTGSEAGWFPCSETAVKLSFSWLGSVELNKDVDQIVSPTPIRNVGGSPGRSNFLSVNKMITPDDVRYSKEDDVDILTSDFRRILQLSVRAAKGLRAVNLGGKSDPFVVVSLRGTRKKSKPIKNTLDPVWTSLHDCDFRFGDVEELSLDDEVMIVVKDWDPTGNSRDLGQVRFLLNEIEGLFGNIANNEAWFKLLPTLYIPGKAASKDLGSILLRATLNGPNQIKSALNDSALTSSSPTSPLSDPLLDPKLLHRSTSSSKGSATTVEKPRLFVRVVQARNLFASDFGGVSDPYAVLRCRSETKRTVTRHKTLAPLYDFETTFGEKDYLDPNDELIVTFFDQDSVISSLVDDDLGSVRIPLWSLLSNENLDNSLAQLRWYSLDPVNSKQRCSGEVQLALSYTNPSLKKPDLYKGKVWLFELQATVHTARNLAAMSSDPLSHIRPYCTVVCGSKDKWRTRVSTNGVNPTWAERFRFRKSSQKDAERDGIQKTDALKVTVFNHANRECLGCVVLDVAFIMDKLGYVDPQGKSFTEWFDLEPLASSDDGDYEGGDDESETLRDEGNSITVETASQDANPTSPGRSLLGMPFLRRSSSNQSGRRSTSEGTSSSPGPSAVQSRPSSPLSARVNDVLGDLRVKSRGQLRLSVRLVPIGETRVKAKQKLCLYLDNFKDEDATSQEPRPLVVYAKCRVGSDIKISAPTMLFVTPLGSSAPLHAQLTFDEEIEWLFQEANRRRAHDERLARKRKYSGNTLSLTSIDTEVFHDTVAISINSASDDSVLAKFSTTFADSFIGARNANEVHFELTEEVKPSQRVQMIAKVVDVKEEMVPLLGHLLVKLVSFKSLTKPRFDTSVRFVIRHAQRVFASRAISGDPCPSLADAFNFESVRFPVYSAFEPVVIEFWQTRTSTLGVEPGEQRSARNLARSVLSMFKRVGEVATGSNETLEGSKWGNLIASATLSVFDIIEIEAKTVFDEDGLSVKVPEHGFKLRLRDKNGVDIGSLWLQARYAENIGGLLSPNPNPAVQTSKPFSLANFRHEVNRLIKIVSWLSAFGSHIGAMLNWDSPVRTIGAIVTVFTLCTVDWFSARWLMFFPFCVLIHLINRHRLRSNGMLLSEFEESDDLAGESAAEIRLACIKATPGKSQLWRKVHAQVSFVARPGKAPKVLGNTRADSRLDGGEADFTLTKVGYSVRSIGKTRPNLLMWKYSESLPSVPSFTFRAENFTIMRDTVLTVTVFAATNLIAADSNGLSDPFVKIHLRDAVTGNTTESAIRSRVCPKTLNPVWNERFVLGEKKAVSPSNTLVLSLFDSDVLSTSNDPLGVVELELANLEHLFPISSNSTHLTQEQRAEEGRKWFKVEPTKSMKKKTGDMDLGKLCVHVEWMRIHKCEQLMKKQPEIRASVDGDPAGIEEEEVPVDSWIHCGAQIAIDVFDQRDIFLGRALFPVGAIVQSDEMRIQPLVTLDLPLKPKYDGSKDDVKDLATDVGRISLQVLVTLPDPKTKERRMAMLEAKRADRSNALQKMRMITKHLEKVQAQLAAVNARAERLKNLFNWTHPRRTKVMFNLFTFLMILFMLIPSRFFILIFVLFFFTERFRPMGTMGSRFKHLLSQMPTDDDLRLVVQSDAVSGKRKILSGVTKANNDAYLLGSTSPARMQNQSLRMSTAGEKGAKVGKKQLAAVLQSISAGDALFAGSLAYCKLPKGGIDKLRLEDLTRRFFIVSSIGLHFWLDRESTEESKPQGHFTGVRNAFPKELTGLLPADIGKRFFVVECDEDSILFYASSERKRQLWLEAIRESLL